MCFECLNRIKRAVKTTKKAISELEEMKKTSGFVGKIVADMHITYAKDALKALEKEKEQTLMELN